mmetsp:Transcript_14393/g.42670  ORF Transcript_14393/g.42670 Transcript_14393/m.42670 type:complete len:376 (-) Transcript_14393:1480-2607(-)
MLRVSDTSTATCLRRSSSSRSTAISRRKSARKARAVSSTAAREEERDGAAPGEGEAAPEEDAKSDTHPDGGLASAGSAFPHAAGTPPLPPTGPAGNSCIEVPAERATWLATPLGGAPSAAAAAAAIAAAGDRSTADPLATAPAGSRDPDRSSASAAPRPRSARGSKSPRERHSSAARPARPTAGPPQGVTGEPVVMRPRAPRRRRSSCIRAARDQGATGATPARSARVLSGDRHPSSPVAAWRRASSPAQRSGAQSTDHPPVCDASPPLAADQADCAQSALATPLCVRHCLCPSSGLLPLPMLTVGRLEAAVGGAAAPPSSRTEAEAPCAGRVQAPASATGGTRRCCLAGGCRGRRWQLGGRPCPPRRSRLRAHR